MAALVRKKRLNKQKMPDTSEAELSEVLRSMRVRRTPLADASKAAPQHQRLRDFVRGQVAQVPKMRRARRRANRMRGAVAGSLAIAAGIVLFLSFSDVDEPVASCELSSVRGKVLLAHGEAIDLATTQHTLGPTDGIRTLASAKASLLTPGGVELGVGGLTHLEFIGQTKTSERIKLLEGRITVAVPKLGSKRSFSVVTPDATVTVHGTRFIVDVQSGSSCVRVSEGLVAVHSSGNQTWLRAGSSWGCSKYDSTAEPTTETATTDRTETDGKETNDRAVNNGAHTQKSRLSGKTTSGASEAARSRQRNRLRRPKQRSGLERQNQLFQDALRAQEQGRLETSARLFRLFLRRYSDATLAPQAREQLRAIESSRE